MAEITVPRRELRTVTLHSLAGIRDDVKEGFNASARSCRRSRQNIRQAIKNQSGDTVDVKESDLSTVIVECNIGTSISDSYHDWVISAKDELKKALEVSGYW